MKDYTVKNSLTILITRNNEFVINLTDDNINRCTTINAKFKVNDCNFERYREIIYDIIIKNIFFAS
jgi:hypothetical protein